MVHPDIIKAHEHSDHHRDELFNSEICGCFYCLATFKPDEIEEWTNEFDGAEVTALCPHCGIDSVIGSASGYPITHEFLSQMYEYWFNTFDE